MCKEKPYTVEEYYKEEPCEYCISGQSCKDSNEEPCFLEEVFEESCEDSYEDIDCYDGELFIQEEDMFE